MVVKNAQKLPPPPDITNNIDYSNRGVEAKLHYAIRKDLHMMLGASIADFEQNGNRFLWVPEKTIDMGITYKHSIKKRK